MRRATITLMQSLALLLLIGVGTGCYGLGMLLIALEGLPGGIESAQGRAECVGQPCDPDQWLVFQFGSRDVIPRAPWHTCSQRYLLDFASDTRNPIVTASVNVSESLLLATTTKDGVLHISEFGDTRSLRDARIDAVGVAWSNAGDRLAVVRRGAAPTEYILEILTPALDPLQSFILELPAEPEYWPDSFGWFLAVSWNPFDTLVAVSTPVTHEQADIRASIASLDTGNVDYHPISSVYFIGETTFVANDDVCKPCTAVFDLTEEKLSRRRILVRKETPFASDPYTGAFVTTYHDDRSLRIPYPATGFRTIDLGPSIIGIYTDPFVLVPIHEATLTLVAAGFGPDDAPRADDKGGCPTTE